jgi:hypothetical protein
MSLIRMWGAAEGIAPAALARLEALLGIAGLTAMRDPEAAGEPGSESRQQSLVRLEAAEKDVLLWRNNVGACKTDTGFLRYGLCNDSERMNEAIKSSDLVGIRKVFVTPQMVGSTVGVFTARECKKQDWKFSESDKRAVAQLKFINLVNSYGGDAAFATGQGTL